MTFLMESPAAGDDRAPKSFGLGSAERFEHSQKPALFQGVVAKIVWFIHTLSEIAGRCS